MQKRISRPQSWYLVLAKSQECHLHAVGNDSIEVVLQCLYINLYLCVCVRTIIKLATLRNAFCF